MKKIIETLNEQSTLYYLEFLAMAAMLIPLSVILCTTLIANHVDYNINLFLSSRLIGFIAFIGCVTLFKYFRLFGISYAIKTNLYSSVTALFFIIVGLIFSLLIYTLQTTFNQSANNAFLLFALIYISIHGWALTDRLTKLTLSRKIIETSLIFIGFFVLILPYLTPHYLNSESYPNDYEVNYLKTKIENIPNYQNVNHSIVLTDTELDIVRSNIALLSLSDSKSKIGKFNLYGNKFVWKSNVDKLSALCLLIDHSRQKKTNIQSIENCVDSLATEKYGISNTIGNLVFINARISASVYEDVHKSLYKTPKFEDQLSSLQHLSVMLVRGALFHHYNSIAQTIYSYNSITELFTNQYGFGPLSITALIGKITNLTIFDSLFYSILITNLFVGILVAYSAWRKENQSTVWLGFILSIYITYSISNILAPFLYFIRYLPTILFCLYIYSKDEEIANNKFREPYWLLFTLLIAIYNTEYAFLTLSAILVVAWYWKKTKLAFLAFGGIILSALIKVIFSSHQATATNYFYYLAGVGMGEAKVGVISSLYLILLGLIAFSKRKKIFQLRQQSDFAQVLLFVITVFLSVKVIWNGGANHIGPLFLILGLILALDKDKTKNKNSMAIDKKAFLFLSIVISIISTISLIFYSYNSKFPGVRYIQSSLSDHFEVSSALKTKMDNFQSIYKEDYLLLSPIDNALSLYVNKKTTAIFPDISTNINLSSDINFITGKYLLLKKPIVIDKVLVNYNQDISNLTESFNGVSKNTNQLLYEYANNNFKLNKVYESIRYAGYNQCNENQDFIVLCPNN